MKKYFVLIMLIGMAANMHAIPFKKIGAGGLFGKETKAVKDSRIRSGAKALTRAEETKWNYGKPIYELPESGTHKLYNRSCDMFYYSMNGLTMSSDEYFAGEVVYYDNGDVYLRNMIPSMTSGSYLKGTLKDNKITVEFPQVLCYEDPYIGADDQLVTDGFWPVFRGKSEIAQVWDEEYEDYVNTIDVWVDPDCQTITFTVNEDGSITQDEEDVMIGVFTQHEGWYEESAWNFKFLPFDEKPQTIPEGLVAEDWVFYNSHNAYMTKLAFDGNDIYWLGMYKGLPESVVKGKVEGNKVYFDSPTFLGVDETTWHLAYFAGTETVNNRLVITDKPKLNYNAAKKQITYARKYLIVNAGPSKVNIIAQFDSPILHYQGGEIEYSSPQKPTVQWVSDWEMDPSINAFSWMTVVDIPNVDTNGNYLDRDRMWYNFYFDDEIFWFDEIDYQLVSASTDVPYNYDDGWNFYCRDFEHYVYFYWTGFRKMGVQSVFEDLKGNVYKSEIEEFINYNSDIKHVDKEEQPVSVAYYDMLGRKIQQPAGFCIKKSTYSDGSVRTKKIIRK